MKKKKIVLLASDGFSTKVVYNSLSKDFLVGKIIIENPVPRLQFLKRRAKRLGWTKIFGQIFFQAGLIHFLRRESRDRVAEIKFQYGLDDSEVNISKVTRVDSVNSDKMVSFLKEQNPHLVVVNGTRIIEKRVLQCIQAPFINMHAGITPLFRGVHGGYWSLVEGKPNACGVTIHLVDPGIDTGKILGQALISPTLQDNFVTYPILQLAAGLPLMLKAVKNLLDDKVDDAFCPEGQSKLWSHPTIWEYFFYRCFKGVK